MSGCKTSVKKFKRLKRFSFESKIGLYPNRKYKIIDLYFYTN